MANQFSAMAPTDYKIEILGITWDGLPFNTGMTDGRDLPWVHDSSGEVTTSWGAGYRDVVILDPANGRPVDPFNLTTNNLAIAKNYIALRSLLLDLAVLRDDDGDRISDFWEMEMLAGTAASPSDDNDGDRADLLTEYSLASREGDAGDLPEIGTTIIFAMGGQRYHAITFRQRLGASGGLSYVVESADGLESWGAGKGAVVEVSRINPYDGTGTEIVTLRASEPVSGGGQLRVRVDLP